mmetsp:Transcript_28415/g.84004  ORF Transcript_28415/g.84004 Transcript_28415/m.84004 type:complete len:487 (-) Transcript_28415:358-1818(-)
MPSRTTSGRRRFRAAQARGRAAHLGLAAGRVPGRRREEREGPPRRDLAPLLHAARPLRQHARKHARTVARAVARPAQRRLRVGDVRRDRALVGARRVPPLRAPDAAARLPVPQPLPAHVRLPSHADAANHGNRNLPRHRLLSRQDVLRRETGRPARAPKVHRARQLDLRAHPRRRLLHRALRRHVRHPAARVVLARIPLRRARAAGQRAVGLHAHTARLRHQAPDGARLRPLRRPAHARGVARAPHRPEARAQPLDPPPSRHHRPAARLLCPPLLLCRRHARRPLHRARQLHSEHPPLGLHQRRLRLPARLAPPLAARVRHCLPLLAAAVRSTAPPAACRQTRRPARLPPPARTPPETPLQAPLHRWPRLPSGLGARGPPCPLPLCRRRHDRGRGVARRVARVGGAQVEPRAFEPRRALVARLCGPRGRPWRRQAQVSGDHALGAKVNALFAVRGAATCPTSTVRRGAGGRRSWRRRRRTPVTFRE